ncbi:unnamed protein product [Rhizophagus irregularis]|nr:unnamed protein product [Rhizophagus irregularis]
MDFGWNNHPILKSCYRLPIANPGHSEYLGRLDREPFEASTIIALQDEFNEIMQKRNLSHIRRIFAAQRYSDTVAKPFVLLKRHNKEHSDDKRDRRLNKKKKKKKKQNKKTD